MYFPLSHPLILGGNTAVIECSCTCFQMRDEKEERKKQARANTQHVHEMLSCLGSSVGRALCLEYRVSWVRVPPEAAHFF